MQISTIRSLSLSVHTPVLTSMTKSRPRLTILRPSLSELSAAKSSPTSGSSVFGPVGAANFSSLSLALLTVLTSPVCRAGDYRPDDRKLLKTDSH